MLASTISVALEGARLNAILVAAIEFRLADYLSSGPASAAELAERAGISERGCLALLDGMVGLRLLHVSNGRYENTDTSRDYLLSSSPKYVGAHHPALFRAWLPLFGQMNSTVKTGHPPHELNSPETLDLWSLLTPALAHSTAAVARHTIDTVGLAEGDLEILDIGGGAAALYADAILSLNSTAHVTQVDWPRINQEAYGRLSGKGLADRFHRIDGNFHDVPFGEKRYDVALLSNIMHQESVESNVRLFRKIASALRETGRLAVIDWVVDDGRTGPAPSLIFNATMLLLSPGGKSYERSEIEHILSRSGFNAPVSYTLVGAATLVITRKSKYRQGE